MYHRYKQYRRYRNDIQDVFNPSLKTANIPNYYQRKGRTIQQTPLKMKNTDTKTITRNELEKMYNKLILYKYPLPINERTPIYLPIILKVKDEFQGDPLRFTSNDLFTKANGIMEQRYPNLLASGRWHYECIGVQFMNNMETDIDENVTYEIRWISAILPSGYCYLLYKYSDEVIVSDSTSCIISVVPEKLGENPSLSVIRAHTSQSGVFHYQEQQYENGDPNPSGKALYPLIDTSLLPADPLYGEFGLNMVNGEYTEVSMTLFVVAVPD